MIVFGDATTPDAIRASAANAVDKFRAGMSNADLYKEIAAILAKAQDVQRSLPSPGLFSTIPPAAAPALAPVVAQLQTVRNQAKIAYNNAPPAPSALVAEAKAAANAYASWGAAFITGVVTTSKARADAVKNAPGDALKWAGDQARNGLAGLGLPSWAIPAALGILGVGVAAYAAHAAAQLIPRGRTR